MSEGAGKKLSLHAQIKAVEAARRVVTGASRAPARASERDYAAECLEAAERTLKRLAAHEGAIRAAMSAKGSGEAGSAGEGCETKRRFAELPLGQQSALRCGSAAFQKFLGASDALQAAEAVRRVCDVSSRSEFDSDAAAGQRWRALDDRFAAWMDCA